MVYQLFNITEEGSEPWADLQSWCTWPTLGGRAWVRDSVVTGGRPQLRPRDRGGPFRWPLTHCGSSHKHLRFTEPWCPRKGGQELFGNPACTGGTWEAWQSRMSQPRVVLMWSFLIRSEIDHLLSCLRIFLSKTKKKDLSFHEQSVLISLPGFLKVAGLNF